MNYRAALRSVFCAKHGLLTIHFSLGVCLL